MMGCVSREHALRKIHVEDARTAVSLVEAPQSAAAIYAYASLAERDRRIAQWLAAMAPARSASIGLTSVFINGWQNSRWQFPGKHVAHAMFAEHSTSGKICLVRIDLDGRPEALAALNNWCMDRLDRWVE